MAAITTVTATFKKPDDSALASTLIQFSPLSTPYSDTASDEVLIGSTLSATTLASGVMPSIDLVKGYYNVLVGEIESFVILSPGDATTKDITDIEVQTNTSGGGVGGKLVSATDILASLDSSVSVGVSAGGDRNAAPTTFAVIGNFGDSAKQDYLDVAAVTLASGATEIITTGNNNYPSGLVGTIEANVASQFNAYLKDYTGIYPSGPATNHFWPAIGYVDYGAGTPSITGHTGFFVLPNNERYYSQVIGDVELFVIDSNQNEPDGYVQGSTQGGWIQTALAASTAIWKIAVFWDAIESSVDGWTNATWMEWPLADWGADMVFMGGPQVYERLEIDTIPYFIVGNGGAVAVDTFGSVAAESQARHAEHGFLRMDVTEYSLKTQMVTKAGVVRDQFELLRTGAPKVVPDVLLDPHGSIQATATGLALETGGSISQIVRKYTTNSAPTGLTSEIDLDAKHGWVISAASAPDVAKHPEYRYCIWQEINGNGAVDPAYWYYWNETEKLWTKYTDPDTTTPYSPGGQTTLATPDVAPEGGLARMFDITHTDGTVDIHYSVNGADFGVFSGDEEILPLGHSSVAAYARKVDNIDSPVVIFEFWNV